MISGGYNPIDQEYRYASIVSLTPVLDFSILVRNWNSSDLFVSSEKS